MKMDKYNADIIKNITGTGWLRHTVIRLAIVLLVVLSGLCLGNVAHENGAGSVSEAKTIAHRGVWVAFYEFSAAGLSNRTEAAFRVNAEKLFKNIKSYGCNDVYFHVRMFDDAIYPSNVVGWSEYISSDKRSPGYDPLQILVEACHAKGLKFHAWMNPYRVTADKILNPAKQKTIDRITAQVKEIIDNYEVDGIHFDDYFYSGTKYASVKPAKRRKKVNKMVRAVYRTVKAKDENLLFGISPAGNYEYAMEIGADVKTWMSNPGYIDYIIPQIYWSDQYKLGGKVTSLFSERLELWRSLNVIDVPMYIGLGLYRTGIASSTDLGWGKKDTNIAEQIGQISSGNSEGYVLFAYTDLFADHAKNEVQTFLNAIAWIKLNKTSVELKPGETFTLEPKWKPAKYVYGDDFEFKSFDETIATVDDMGVITAVSPGTVKIQVYAEGKKKNCTVTVSGDEPVSEQPQN
ncbi:MAG: family 10 glycosylhydrolase [Eubacterium sp.]|nr:family 10 glycosylhydrolase [Eubacterium sp.]